MIAKAVIPHITDMIKQRIIEGAGDSDVAIVEIGGTVGDIPAVFGSSETAEVQVGSRNAIFILTWCRTSRR